MMINDHEKIISSAVDDYAEKLLSDFKVPGMAVSVILDGSLVFAKGYGVRQLGEHTPVDQHSLFGIASISKSFTAMALGMLVDDGKIKWGDRVTKYLPSFQLYDRYASGEITILDLLIHRSGLSSVSGGTIWYGSDYSRQEIIDRIRYLKPASSFRSEYAYQNITYLVAGEIVQVVTGQTWDEFITQRIFTPLEMRSSNTSITMLLAEMNVAQPHIEVNGTLRVIAHRNYDNVGPAAAINTTISDLAAYAQLLLGGGIYKGDRLYSTAIGQDLWRPQSLVPMVDDYPVEIQSIMPQFHSTYALGWQIQDFYGLRKVSHSGGIDGLRSRLTLIPEQNLGVIVFANNEGPVPWILSEIILGLYQKADPKGWYAAAREWWAHEKAKQNSLEQKTQSVGTQSSLDLESYQGEFHSAPVGDIRVEYKDDQLILRFPHTDAFTGILDHWHYDTFRVKWQDPCIPDGLLTFILGAQALVTELKLTQTKLLDVDFNELHPITRIVD